MKNFTGMSVQWIGQPSDSNQEQGHGLTVMLAWSTEANQSH